MALTFAAFKAALRTDQDRIEARQSVEGILSCAACETPLQESVTGCRPLPDGSHLCSDCYFESFGREFDEHPIAMPRALRQA